MRGAEAGLPMKGLLVVMLTVSPTGAMPDVTTATSCKRGGIVETMVEMRAMGPTGSRGRTSTASDGIGSGVGPSAGESSEDGPGILGFNPEVTSSKKSHTVTSDCFLVIVVPSVCSRGPNRGTSVPPTGGAMNGRTGTALGDHGCGGLTGQCVGPVIP